MKLTTFSLIIIFLLTFSIGCSTENPICTDSFCLIPRDAVGDQPVIEIDESKVLELIGKTSDPLPIGDITPQPESTTLLMTIIKDVGINGENSQYNGKTVAVTGYVVWKNDDGESMAIYKNASFVASGKEPAIFLVLSRAKGVKLDQYSVSERYTFTFTIETILPPKPPSTRYTIAGVLAN